MLQFFKWISIVVSILSFSYTIAASQEISLRSLWHSVDSTPSYRNQSIPNGDANLLVAFDDLAALKKLISDDIGSRHTLPKLPSQKKSLAATEVETFLPLWLSRVRMKRWCSSNERLMYSEEISRAGQLIRIQDVALDKLRAVPLTKLMSIGCEGQAVVESILANKLGVPNRILYSVAPQNGFNHWWTEVRVYPDEEWLAIRANSRRKPWHSLVKPPFIFGASLESGHLVNLTSEYFRCDQLGPIGLGLSVVLAMDPSSSVPTLVGWFRNSGSTNLNVSIAKGWVPLVRVVNLPDLLLKRSGF